MDAQAQSAFRLHTLHKAIAAVCPIDGAWLGDPEDRGSWGYWPKEEATEPQKTAADNVIQTLDVDGALATEEAAQDAAVVRDDAIKVSADYTAMLNLLKTATPAEWQTYLTNNMTTLAEARTVIYRMGLAIMLLARSLP